MSWLRILINTDVYQVKFVGFVDINVKLFEDASLHFLCANPDTSDALFPKSAGLSKTHLGKDPKKERWRALPNQNMGGDCTNLLSFTFLSEILNRDLKLVSTI